MRSTHARTRPPHAESSYPKRARTHARTHARTQYLQNLQARARPHPALRHVSECNAQAAHAITHTS